MNSSKSWFALINLCLAITIAALAAWVLAVAGFNLSWLGALIASAPIVALAGLEASGRGSRSGGALSAGLILVALAGLALAVWGFLRGSFWGGAGVAAAAMAAAAFVLFLNWYSLVARSVNPQLVRGRRLPEFAASDSAGNAVGPSTLLGKPAVLLFYRGNWCPICMAQIKEIAASYQSLIQRGASVVLISPQPHDLTERVAKLYDVPFQFWVDKDTAAARQLGLVHNDGVPEASRGRYGKDTVFPTAIVTGADGRILYANQSDNFRERPKPREFAEVLAEAGY